MIIIGITGPTGAGKTTALRQLEELGGVIINCDAVYHQLLESETTLQKELYDRFGLIMDEHGNLDRKKLGAVVFGKPEALVDLNNIVQPYISQAVHALLEQAERQGAPAAAVDGITIIESGLAACCDATVAVLASGEDRVKRICQREGIPEDYARARVAAQKDDAFFKENCDYVLYNDHPDAEAFGRYARDMFEKLIGQSR